MAQNKNSFLLYSDTIHTVKKLTDEQAGQLFKHVLEYVNDENPVTDNIIIEIAFEPIKQSLKRDLKKYEKICERNKNNGSKGGRPINPEEPKKPSGLFGNPEEPKKPDIDIDIDIDIENKKVFDFFRKKFPGTKRGLETEFENLKKKHKDWKNIINLLSTAIDNQITSREAKKQKSQFVPEWKNMQTWINQRCWEEEIFITVNKPELVAR